MIKSIVICQDIHWLNYMLKMLLHKKEKLKMKNNKFDINNGKNSASEISRPTKIIISVLISASCICLFGMSILSDRHEKGNNESTVDSQVETSTDSEESTTEAPKCTDMELLTIEGHPTFYGSSEKAHEVWDKYSAEDTVMIKGFVGHSSTYDDAILVLDCFKNGGMADSDIINGVHITFSNFSDGKKVGFQEALSIASDYFPYEIMSEKYSLFESCYQKMKKEEKPYYKYFINYKMKDVTQSSAYDHDLPYDCWVSVVFYVDSEENVDSISISTDRASGSRYESEKFEWGYDFLSN